MSDPNPTQDDLLGLLPSHAPGKVIGANFRLVRKIGAGAMGDVYQAEQLSLGKMVAIKLLRSELMGDEKLVKRFELEARSASSLDHPNSIQIIDFGRDGDVLYIAMELLAGIDLAQLVLRDGAMPLARAARIMDQVLAALDEAHAHGIVHRDLKPGNIMLVPRRGEPDFVKVCDFGIAKVQSSRPSDTAAMLTIKGIVCGTPEYMSPEQARGEAVDGRSDLYAVSVILYQLITGAIPFSDSSPVGILSKHLTEPPLPPSLRKRNAQIPPALDALVLQGLAKNAGDRPQTASEYRYTLHAAMGHLVDVWPGQGTPPPGSLAAMARSRGAHGPDAETIPAVDAVATVPPPFGGDTWRAERRKNQTSRRLKMWMTALGATAMVVFAFVTFAMREDLVAPPDLAVSPLRPVVTATGHVQPMAVAEAPRPVVEPPALAEPAEAAEPAALPPGALHEVRPATSRPARARVKKEAKLAATRRAPAPAVTAAPMPAPVSPPSPSEAAPALASAPPAPVSAPSGVADVLREAERLLGQGDAAAACKRAEEARQLSPRSPAAYRLLGKCHMRAGSHERARESYSRYLELAPDAPDAAFIKSIVKK